MYQDTIYAPITALGNGSIYTIRISGDKTIKCLNELGVEKKLEHRKATLFKIKDKSGELLDEALLLFFKSPYSFTGEDICEISLHCSQYIINEVFDILSSIDGVRFAERGAPPAKRVALLSLIRLGIDFPGVEMCTGSFLGREMPSRKTPRLRYMSAAGEFVWGLSNLRRYYREASRRCRIFRYSFSKLGVNISLSSEASIFSMGQNSPRSTSSWSGEIFPS